MAGTYWSYRLITYGGTSGFKIWPHSEASSIKCNVTNWEDQVALFEHAFNRYGVIDIVVGISLIPTNSRSAD